MDELITDFDQVTPEWMTQLLQVRQVLPEGKIIDVRISDYHRGFTSIGARIDLEYHRATPPGAPEQLFIKIARPNLNPAIVVGLSNREIRFYRHVADPRIAPPIVRCYDAVYDDASHRFHLVLACVSNNHFQLRYSIPPSRARSEQIIDALARMHAFWWEHPKLGDGLGRLFNDVTLDKYLSSLAVKVDGFLSYVGDRLSPHARQIYEFVLSSPPTPWMRRMHVRNLTLTHGDTHLGNFFLGDDPVTHPVYIIDWQMWNVDVGPKDVAIMLTTHLGEEQRVHQEVELIRWYFDRLLAHGVSGYTWDECWADYRLAAIQLLMVPIIKWSHGQAERYWWQNMERAVRTFQQLNCEEMLQV